MLTLILAVAMLLSLASVAPAENEVTLRISWWGSQTRHDRTLAAIDLFEEQNPGVTIEAEYSSWDGYWDRLAALVAANDLPDIIQQDLQYIRQYVDKGLHVDLTPYVESGALNLSDAEESFWSGGKLDGKLYALNLGTNSLMQVYDPVMLEAAGVEMLQPGYDWDDYVAFLRELKAKLSDDVYPAATVVTNQIYNLITHRARQLGMNFYSTDGKSLGVDVDTIQWCFEFCKTLTDDGLIAPMDVRLEIINPEDDLIVHELAALTETNSNQFIAIQRAADRPLAANIMPIADDQVAFGQYIKPSQFFSIAQSSKDVDLCVKFLDYFTNSLECNQILLAERGVPISAHVREGIKPFLSEYDSVVFDFIGVAGKYADPISPPEPAGHSEVHARLKYFDQSVCFGEIQWPCTRPWAYPKII